MKPVVINEKRFYVVEEKVLVIRKHVVEACSEDDAKDIVHEKSDRDLTNAQFVQSLDTDKWTVKVATFQTALKEDKVRRSGRGI